MSQKTILLCVPHLAGFADLMEQALNEHHFHVINLATMARKTRRYPSFYAWLHAKYRKIVHRDRHAAQHAKCQYWQSLIEQQLGNKPLDYALFISGHEYSNSFLQFAQQRSLNGSVNYQFDGMNRYPEIYDKLQWFDKFYAFNPNDVQQHQLQAASNFYFTHLPQTPTIEHQFYFTGTHHQSRQMWINQFANYATQQNWQIHFNVIHNLSPRAAQRHYPNQQIHLRKRPLRFMDNIVLAQKSQILVDFVVDWHTGLSFRSFEALGYRKKLITTNPEIAKYDFYHPNNILIWNGQNFDNMADFIQQPYHELPPHIYEKYSFGNWIRHILNIEPHIKITLPTD